MTAPATSDAGPTPAARRPQATRFDPRVRAAARLWCVLGVAAPVVAVLVQPAQLLDSAALIGALALLTAVFSQLSSEFEIAGQRVVVSPHTEPLLVAAVLLGPAETLVVAAAGMTWSLRGQSLLGAASTVANATLPYAAASIAVHQLLGAPLHAAGGGAVAAGGMLLAAGSAAALWVMAGIVVASLVGEALAALGGGLVLESVRRGQARSYLSSYASSLYFDVGVPALAVAIAAPAIAASAGGGLALLAGLQLFSFAGFRLLARERQEQERARHLHETFARYVPATVVEELVDTYRLVELGGQQRDISVLFCDVRDFTSWSEGLPPSVVIAELNALLSELSEAVLEHGGTLDKFTGDGLMAFWGAPAQQPDHASRAVQAAAAMVQRLARHNELRALRGQDPQRIGVGVHSGPAVIGNVGHRDRLDYTAIGDTVNLAARLEAATRQLGHPVLISSATWGQLSDAERSPCEAVGAVRVKGRAQAVDAFALLPGDDATPAAPVTAALPPAA